MTPNAWVIVDAGIILVMILGVALFRSPTRARAGNLVSALALALAAASLLIRHDLHPWVLLLITLALGTMAGAWVAFRVTMIQIPAMVALQHGAGGVAAFLVSFVEVTSHPTPGFELTKVVGLLGLIIGAATFSGSLVASGKLTGIVSQRPWRLRGHGFVSLGVVAGLVACVVLACLGKEIHLVAWSVALIVQAIFLGWLVSIRIGGADMPVLISFLNATAGVAAAFCGVIIGNRLLVACGATVAASGSILTHVMCKAMNRSLWKVFLGFQAKPQATWLPGLSPSVEAGVRQEPAAPEEAKAPAPPVVRDHAREALAALQSAKRVVIAPGYGMALAQAQFEVIKLSKLLESQGKQVKFAIHPVAGRMPGHMNVLLAEADLPYDQLFEMDAINPEFKETDVALVIGACDVVNPAAVVTEGTPITGMPILNVHEARHVVVCNLDERPGYSGVENLLYHQAHVSMLLGDAKETLSRLIVALEKPTAASPGNHPHT